MLPDELKKRVEALLFIISKGLSSEEISIKLGCQKEEAEKAITELKKDYD
jgi:chromosome segregation and condensation protein ScpB